jgi:DNA processing protein
VAVLPGGLDAITPRGHEALAESLCARGALVSERLSGPPGFRGAFVKRNRLIAALAGATVVVEAAERSGALSTAAAARRLGRALLAVPGDVDRPTSRGTNALLGSGARLCASAADAVDALGGADHDEAGDAGAERRLMAALDGTARTAEDLARAAGLTTGDALARLLALEWAGVARRGPGPRWSGRKG